MIVTHIEYAPLGSVFSLFAFDEALGKTHALRVDGETIGEAALVGAVPGERMRYVTLFWSIGALTGDWFTHYENYRSLPLDDFIPEDAFNPERANKIVEAMRSRE
jgi:hypothetical protein